MHKNLFSLIAYFLNVSNTTTSSLNYMILVVFIMHDSILFLI